MDVIMLQTIRESINEGRTAQEFVKDLPYQVPDAVGQLWIARGLAVAAAAARETSHVKRETSVRDGGKR